MQTNRMKTRNKFIDRILKGSRVNMVHMLSKLTGNTHVLLRHNVVQYIHLEKPTVSYELYLPYKTATHDNEWSRDFKTLHEVKLYIADILEEMPAQLFENYYL